MYLCIVNLASESYYKSTRQFTRFPERHEYLLMHKAYYHSHLMMMLGVKTYCFL